MQLPNGSGWPWRQTKKEEQHWRSWVLPYSSGWPGYGGRKKSKKKERILFGFYCDLIMIEIGVLKNKKKLKQRARLPSNRNHFSS